mmetsp:Transcript_51778/g.133525  ORF Transcript_51778/g.133525 Transcript_51778/m.133525 type:complete len:293 (+) Transcript_51778:92-970(+)
MSVESILALAREVSASPMGHLLQEKDEALTPASSASTNDCTGSVSGSEVDYTATFSNQEGVVFPASFFVKNTFINFPCDFMAMSESSPASRRSRSAPCWGERRRRNRLESEDEEEEEEEAPQLELPVEDASPSRPATMGLELLWTQRPTESPMMPPGNWMARNDEHQVAAEVWPVCNMVMAPGQGPMMLMQHCYMPSVTSPTSEVAVAGLAETDLCLISIGSGNHHMGRCKPCAFIHTKGCASGVNCTFCHLCDPGEKKRRQQEKWERRQQRQRKVTQPLEGQRRGSAPKAM